jgi:hypothetical protein
MSHGRCWGLRINPGPQATGALMLLAGSFWLLPLENGCNSPVVTAF